MKKLRLPPQGLWLGLAFAALCLAAQSAHAGVLTFNVGGTEYSGNGAPAIEQNAVTITATDYAPDVVRFSVRFNTAVLSSTSFIDKLSLNIADSFQASPTSTLNLRYLSSSVARLTGFTFQTPEDDISLGADGSKGWDIQLLFSTSSTFSGMYRFRDGETVSFELSAAGLDVTDFNYFNSGGTTLANASVHIAGFSAAPGSGWWSNTGPYTAPPPPPAPAPVPEPASLAIWSALGLVGCVVAHKRRKTAAH